MAARLETIVITGQHPGAEAVDIAPPAQVAVMGAVDIHLADPLAVVVVCEAVVEEACAAEAVHPGAAAAVVHRMVAAVAAGDDN